MSAREFSRSIVEVLSRIPRLRDRSRDLSKIQYILQRRQLFTDLNIDLVLDVGANQGQFAEDVRKFYKGEIISFEPVSHPYLKLSNAAQQDRRWKVENFACGNQNTSLKINVSNSTVFSSFLMTSTYCAERFGTDSAVSATESVTVKRLDDYLKSVGIDLSSRRTFLKMDTQGYDSAVFEGLGELARDISALQSEVSVIPIYDQMNHWTETVLAYEKVGFSVCGFYPVNYEGVAAIEFDCLMVNRARSK